MPLKRIKTLLLKIKEIENKEREKGRERDESLVNIAAPNKKEGIGKN